MPATAVANPITLQQAQQNALSFLESKGKSISSSSLRQAQFRSTSAATESYYIFNIGSNEGYVIAAGDDCAPAILGYADAGYIDVDSMPVNLQSWLEEYAQQIQFMQENGFASLKAPKLTSSYAVIPPLMTTTWDQQDPYNQYCPDFFSYGKCVTGCVATAMAQVMYYHRANSVTQTTAQIPAYDCGTLWLNGTDTLGHIHVNAIPAGSPIDWNNMLDSYSGSTTPTQKQAVANLMKYCGSAVQMNYANAWNGGSGAYSSDVPIALKSYFNYSDETTLQYRSNYSSDAAWESLVYTELSSSRPVYYSGSNSSGGHAFVCDGYDGSGYYHINWGWSGTSDGYFLLTALDPNQQGTGGSSSGYNQYQAALINAQPKSSSPSNPVLATSISLNKTSAEINTGGTLQLTATVLPSNATNKTVTWTTSNSSVATVNSNGLVTTIASGTVTITARTTDGSNLSASCSVTVKQSSVLVTSISLNKTSAELTEGNTMQLSATVLPSNATNKTVTWTTSNSSVATVSSNGLVTAKNPGTATITSRTTDGSNLSASCSVTVKQSFVLATSISLDKISAEINTGGSLQLTATVLPSNATNKTVTWTTSNSSVATVNSDGLVMAKAVGNATITAKTTDGTNLSATCNITVSNSSIISFADANVKALCVQNWDTNGDGELSTSEAAAVTSLGGVFESKENITSFDELVYFSGLSSIGDRDFYQCSRLTSVTVPNSVTRIGLNAFRRSGLKCVSIPNSVIFIEPGAFANCISIESIIVDNNNPHYDSRSNCNAIIESSTNRLISGCKNTIIPNTVKSIGYLAFIGCSGLSSISIPNSVDTIGIHAFSFCDGLKTIYIPNSVTTIDDYAFYNCSGLTSISIGNSVTTIGEDAFLNCSRLTSIDIPNSVTSIGVGAFRNCSRLTSITIPNSVTTINGATFSGCTGLTSIDIPNSVTSIGGGAFQDCSRLTSIDIPNSVTSIGVGAFYNCSGLTSVTIPNSVTSIGNYAFYNCDWLKDVYSYIEHLSVVTMGNSVFLLDRDDYSKRTLHVPSGLVSTYQANTSWYPYFGAIVEMEPIVLATSVQLNQMTAEATVGGTLQLSATVLPSNATNKAVTWTTSNSSVATVDSNGLVTAVAPGTATITATTTDGSNLSASCAVNVVVPVTSISLDKTSAELVKGNAMKLIVTVLPSNATNKVVTWSSSNPTIASVDDNGLVTALAAGFVTITTMTTDGSNLSASCNVTVTENLSNYDNYLSMSDVDAFRGDTIVIPVKMTNESSIISFQTDIFLPEGIELLQEDGEYLIDPSERMTRTHSIMSNDVSSGAIRVLCYSSNYKPFTGSSGDDLFYITVKVADNAEGDYTIQLKNTLLTNTDFVDLAAPDVAANVNVKAYLLGDANNSGTVSITDVVVTAQYVLELNPQPFVFEAADANVDGNITVADVSRIAWMVLNPTLNAPLRAPALWNNGDRMSAEDITLASGETRRVSILLDNEMDYNAFQLDLNLPEGLTASNFQLTDRSNNHAFEVNTLQNGNIRALCYSPALTVINGHEGALLTFDVTAAGDVNGDILVDGIELVTADCQSVKLDAFAIGINKASRVNELATDKTIAKVEYFNLAGQKMEQPSAGVTLIVTTYTDGSRTTTKVFY